MKQMLKDMRRNIYVGFLIIFLKSPSVVTVYTFAGRIAGIGSLLLFDYLQGTSARQSFMRRRKRRDPRMEPCASPLIVLPRNLKPSLAEAVNRTRLNLFIHCHLEGDVLCRSFQ